MSSTSLYQRWQTEIDLKHSTYSFLSQIERLTITSIKLTDHEFHTNRVNQSVSQLGILFPHGYSMKLLEWLPKRDG